MCQAERLAAAQKAERRKRLREVGRRAAVVSLVAASGITGLSAAFIPAGPMCTGTLTPIAVEVHAAGEMGVSTPVLLETAPPPWSEPLTFRCFQARSDLTCCVVEAP